MEITKKAKTTTLICGSAPALGAKGVFENYSEETMTKVMSFGNRLTKKADQVENKVLEILSVFNHNGTADPIIGGWMVQEMLKQTALAIFNKKDNKNHPSKTSIPLAIGLVKPTYIPLYRGKKVIKKADYVTTHTISLKDRSFFKAYEVLEPGVTMEFTMNFNTDIINEECINMLLDNCQHVGLGAYRARFGKFEWV